MTYFNYAKSRVLKGWTAALAHKFITVGALVGILIVGGSARYLLSSPPATDVTDTSTPRIVKVASISELSNGAIALSIVGTVTSQNEATVRAEKSGQLVRLNYALGDRVAAGATIGEMENQSERAAVAQAQASVDVAKANRAKVTGGSRVEQRSILEAQLINAEQALSGARNSALNSILSAYAAAESAVPGTADALFSNPKISPQLLITTANSQYEIDAENQRSDLQSALSGQSSRSAVLTTNSNLDAEIATAIRELRTVRTFLDTIIAALNVAIPVSPYTESSIATYLASMNTARANVTSALSALSTTQDNLDAKRAAVTIAQKNLEQGVAGGQPEDVAAADANVKQAEAGLAVAYATLQKSIIRAPISGTINMLDLKRGDFVQALAPVVTIANNGSLEVLSYLTEGDAVAFTIGDTVRIDSGDIGTITRIAPALDPVSKKIEMRIALPKTSTLINGQSVIVTASRTQSTATPVRITIPITALKIHVDVMTVLSVDDTNHVIEHPVTIGTLLGDRVEIRDGIDPLMRIITDARGIRVGQEVTVQ